MTAWAVVAFLAFGGLVFGCSDGDESGDDEVSEGSSDSELCDLQAEAVDLAMQMLEGTEAILFPGGQSPDEQAAAFERWQEQYTELGPLIQENSDRLLDVAPVEMKQTLESMNGQAQDVREVLAEAGPFESEADLAAALEEAGISPASGAQEGDEWQDFIDSECPELSREALLGE